MASVVGLGGACAPSAPDPVALEKANDSGKVAHKARREQLKEGFQESKNVLQKSKAATGKSAPSGG